MSGDILIQREQNEEHSQTRAYQRNNRNRIGTNAISDSEQAMDEDVLAIASRGALSDSMQGFRKLADDEASQVMGGIDVSNIFHRHRLSDNFGNPQRLMYYQEIIFSPGEEGSGYATLNGVTSKRIHAEFSAENRPINGATLHFKIVKFANSAESVSIVKFNPITKQEYSVYQGSNMIQALGQSLFSRVLNDGQGRGYIPERQRFFGR
ncbi:MAG: hypothetical protein K2N12_02490 [Helicobacter sp.]|nr:hypothetical protein [Helicobacter sp.]